MILEGRQARMLLRGTEGVYLRRWLKTWDALALWTRYEVHGAEHLIGPRARLVVGYHGRPIAHDLCMLQNALYRHLGYLPHPVMHAAFGENGTAAQIMDELGFVTGDDDTLAQAIARDEHVFVTPGGTREGCRPVWRRYRVEWGRRTGYLKLALKYGLDIVPVASAGADDLFVGLNDGYQWGKRLGVPAGMPAWLGFGLVGMWPLAVPLPAKIRTLVGPPIRLAELGPVDPSDRDALLGLHARVTTTMQALIDQARSLP